MAPRPASSTTPPGPPYRRVLAAVHLDAPHRQRFDAKHAASGPVALRRRLDEAILALGRLHVRSADPLPDIAG